MKPEIHIIRTNSEHKDLIPLVKELDAFLAITDGDEHEFYDQFNKLDTIRHVILLYLNNEAVACGALKEYDQERAEIKRMFTKTAHRGCGLAEIVLEALETWATDLGYSKCILETGIRQTSAIALYQRCGYTPIPCYGQYRNMDNSRCFEKNLGSRE